MQVSDVSREAGVAGAGDAMGAAADGFYIFFYCDGFVADLHSFPTRRSSDLAGWTAECLHLSSVRAQGRAVAAFYRSEEHTSELQSRFDLVCRLLLEKKKYNYPGVTV